MITFVCSIFKKGLKALVYAPDNNCTMCFTLKLFIFTVSSCNYLATGKNDNWGVRENDQKVNFDVKCAFLFRVF